MGLISDAMRKKQQDEQIGETPPQSEQYGLGYEEDEEPSLMEMFARWSGQRIKTGKRKLAEVQ